MNKLSTREIYDNLNAAHRTLYEYELFSGPYFECWNLDSILSTVNDVNKSTYQNPFTLDLIFRSSIPPRMRITNPDKINKMFTDNVHIIDTRDKFDAEMSQYACWALVKQIGDEAIFHQEYFLHPGATLETVRDNAVQTLRIPLRTLVAQYEKQLSGILGKFNQGPHYDRQNYSGIRRKMNLILFDKNTTDQIRMKYKMSEKRPISDYMNTHLLRAYGHMLKDVVDTWNSLIGMRTISNLDEIAQLSATATRSKFRHGRPLDNFERAPINEVIKQRGQREYEFAKRFLNSK